MQYFTYKLKATLKDMKKSPIILWAICFLLTSLIFREDGATNEMSRYATLRAMSDQLSFKIDSYVPWTVDWAKKDGHYYSNKAPGPMLIGFPIFLLLDQFSKFDRKDRKNEQGHRITKVSSTPRVIMSLIFQIIPFIVICLLICKWLQKNTSLGDSSLHFFAISILFANTAAIFMNTYFGHGMSSLFVLAMCLSLQKKNYLFMGLFFGLALLCEYTVALILFPLITSFFIFSSSPLKKWFPSFLLGGVVPGTLWCLYHYKAMGSIIQMPTQYQNPRFIEVIDQAHLLWGIFSLPKVEIIIELLFGFQRGLLVTQPWILVIFTLSIFNLFNKKSNLVIKQISFVATTGLVLLICLNSSFNGWHGGGTSGPRYLAFILPIFSIIGAYFWHNSTKLIKIILASSLGFSVLFRVLVYGSRVTSPEGFSLWPWLLNDLSEKDGMKGEVRALTMLLTLTFIGIYYFKKLRASES